MTALPFTPNRPYDELASKLERVASGNLPTHLRGRPRSWWESVIGPKTRPDFPEGPMFDIDEIMADLEHGGYEAA